MAKIFRNKDIIIGMDVIPPIFKEKMKRYILHTNNTINEIAEILSLNEKRA